MGTGPERVGLHQSEEIDPHFLRLHIWFIFTLSVNVKYANNRHTFCSVVSREKFSRHCLLKHMEEGDLLVTIASSFLLGLLFEL